MKKTIGIIALVFVVSAPLTAGTCKDDDYGVLEVKLGNCCKNLKIDNLMFTIVSKDPMKSYVESLDKDVRSVDAGHPKYAQVQWAWNKIFATVDGNHVWSVSEKTHWLSHTNKYGKRWLVTKGTGTSEENLFWSIPINLKKCKTINIVLDEKNKVSSKKLDSLFDKALEKKKN